MQKELSGLQGRFWSVSNVNSSFPKCAGPQGVLHSGVVIMVLCVLMHKSTKVKGNIEPRSVWGAQR